MGRKILHEFSANYIPDSGEVDLGRLRSAVAELMEKGAHAVQVDGYEQDDVELERWAVMRYAAGEEHSLTVPIEALTDRQRLLAPFHRAA